MYWDCLSYVYRNKPVPVEKRSEYLRDKYNLLFKKYKPEKFNGNILLFRASDTPSSFRYLGWESLVNEIKLVEIEGKHLDVFIGEQNTDALKTEIGKYLEEISVLK